MTVFLETLFSSIKQINAPYMFVGEHGFALHTMRVNRPHLAARVNSQSCSRVTAVTWVIFSSYGADGPPKLVLVQRHQDSCLVKRDNTGISWSLGEAILLLPKVRWGSRDPF